MIVKCVQSNETSPRLSIFYVLLIRTETRIAAAIRVSVRMKSTPVCYLWVLTISRPSPDSGAAPPTLTILLNNAQVNLDRRPLLKVRSLQGHPISPHSLLITSYEHRTQLYLQRHNTTDNNYYYFVIHPVLIDFFLVV